MRRGLLDWKEEEVPAAALEARVARAQAAMREAGLDALLVYTNFPRPSAVSFLTHFVPYWSQGALLVPAEGAPRLYVMLSKRVAGWIEDTAHVAEVVAASKLGETLGRALADQTPGKAARLGVVELAKFNAAILRPLMAACPGVEFEDATALFAAIRHPADEAEIAMARRAAELARDGLVAALAAGPRTSRQLAAVIEQRARDAGAEEVLIDIAPDLDVEPRLHRFENDEPLGARFAVRVSAAYKGSWIRLGRTVQRDAGVVEPFNAAAALEEGEDLLAEACVGCAPLSAVPAPPAGAIVSLSAWGRNEHGPWAASEPVVMPADGGAPVALLG
jgi:hypothetical protein